MLLEGWMGSIFDDQIMTISMLCGEQLNRPSALQFLDNGHSGEIAFDICRGAEAGAA